MKTGFMIGILLFCNLFFLSLSFAERGGVSGGGGGDGIHAQLIVDENSKLILVCPNQQHYSCDECSTAMTVDGSPIQDKLDHLCEKKSAL